MYIKTALSIIYFGLPLGALELLNGRPSPYSAAAIRSKEIATGVILLIASRYSQLGSATANDVILNSVPRRYTSDHTSRVQSTRIRVYNTYSEELPSIVDARMRTCALL